MTDEAFARIQSLYPKREGGQRWADARKAYNARLREKHTPDEIQAGVERYAAYIRSKGQERTCYVQQAATFLGANKGFLEEWTILAEQPKPTKPVMLTADQRHLTEMAALMNRRPKIGIPQFRDPRPGETVTQYRMAQDDAWTAAQDRNRIDDRQRSENVSRLNALVGGVFRK